jgi:hypothetical protein
MSPSSALLAASAPPLKSGREQADLSLRMGGGAEKLHDAIQVSQEDNGRLDSAVLVGWVVVAEWVGPDGTRTLTRMSGTPGGTVPPEWQSRGYLHEALFGKWNTSEA